MVLRTLNLRLHPSDLAYVADHAHDKAVIVDKALLPLLDQFKDQTKIEHVIVVEDGYEELLDTATADEWEDPQLDERAAAAMCFTSGTTGRCKGVVYSHRSTVLHALGVATTSPLGLRVSNSDTLLPVVPDVHANAWGYPYLAAMIGTKLVFGRTSIPKACSRPLSRRRSPGRPASPRSGSGCAADARRRAGQVGRLAHTGHAGRQLLRAARGDRGLQGAAWAQRRAGLGHDRDLARRVSR